MAKDPVRILVTGAAGQIGYALVPLIARGTMLGPDQPVILHLLDIPPAAESLNGVKMELIDAAFPLLRGVVATTNVVGACKDVNIAIMVGGFPRKEGMERKDVMSKNVSIYKEQASALDQYAAENVKVCFRNDQECTQNAEITRRDVTKKSGLNMQYVLKCSSAKKL
ncbi:hypothetical protein O6H91_Y552300 [Diphasiastrum complanatum]|nr:hypothetical protein O6H91_Y552300 [Diphasiastrum complanatum]